MKRKAQIYKRQKRYGRNLPPKLTWSALSDSCNFEKNSEVPDLAMVPRLLTRSLLVMPMPVSVMWRTWLSWKKKKSSVQSYNKILYGSFILGNTKFGTIL